MKKICSVILALAMLIGIMPGFALAEYTPAHTGDELIELAGGAVFDGSFAARGGASLYDADISQTWDGWSVNSLDEDVPGTSTANVRTYTVNSTSMDVLQIYKNNSTTTLDSSVSYFPGASDESGLTYVYAPDYGVGSDFLVLDFYYKVGSTSHCYHDYYFRDANGELIGPALRMDINGVSVAYSASYRESLGSLITNSTSRADKWRFIAWNNDDDTYSVSIEKNASCVYTGDFGGSFAGFGGFYTVMGYYNGTFTHGGFADLKIYTGYFTDPTPETALRALSAPTLLFGGEKLQKSSAGYDIAWTSDAGIVSEGTVLESQESVTAVLTANIGDASRDFRVMLIGKDDGYVAAYRGTSGFAEMDQSLHLALNGRKLNFDTGVLFAGADYSSSVMGETKSLVSPWIFRMKDGSFGVIAQSASADDLGKIYFWTSSDLVNYAYQGMRDISPEAEKLQCGYDEDSDKYVISFTAGGETYYVTTPDFESFSQSEYYTEPRFGNFTIRRISGISSVIALDKNEAARLTNVFGVLENTSVDEIKISTRLGQELDADDLGALTANYSDGSTAGIPVKWNEDELAAIDFDAPGIYTVTGNAVVTDYEFPMIPMRADPDVLYYNGKYYFISTYESGQKVFYIRESDTLAGIATATDIEFLTATPEGDMSGCLWAPELHVIGGELYLLFAASLTGSWSAVESRMMKYSGEGNVCDRKNWGEIVRVQNKDGENLCDEGITLDMTCFEDGGSHYLVWAQRATTAMGADETGTSDLYIAKIDPSEPYKLISDPVLLRKPKYAWERYSATVDEGPYIIKNGSKVYLTFSANYTDTSYCLGAMYADEGEDLTDASAWSEIGYPLLTSNSVIGQYGPGHHSFTVDEYDRPVIVLHAKASASGTRDMTMRNVAFNEDGAPVLYMTAQRYLKDEYRAVTATITVANDGMTEDEILLYTAAKDLAIEDADNIRGNIALPTEIGGFEIEWSSSDESVISTDTIENENYDDTPPGVVTRAGEDKYVTLTAKVLSETVSIERKFDVCVKAAAETAPLTAYLYAYFRGAINGQGESQQIYIASSTDGLNWTDLNGNNPIIVSEMGTRGLRDPYIIRSAEGDRFFLMATDLDASGGNWSAYGHQGSKYLMFWESDDLVNWSEQRMIKISNDLMGDTWAPEAIYDENTGEYIIYWSSTRSDLGNVQVMHYAKTRDFRTFTEPKVYFTSPNSNEGYIDTTMIKASDGKYYRVTKSERTLTVFMEVADAPLGEFTAVESNLSSIRGVEGPCLFKFNDEDKYCLMLDGYASDNSGVGFFPVVCDDLSSGEFTRLTSGFQMPTGPKHGGVIGITQSEYEGILERWGSIEVDEAGSGPVLEYNFDEGDARDSIGENDGTLCGNAQVTEDELKGSVLTLDGTSGSYLAFPTGFFDRRDTFTVSMDVLGNTTANYFFTFAIGNNSTKYMFLRNRSTNLYAAITAFGNNYEQKVQTSTDASNGKWTNLTMVVTPTSIKLYKDGYLAAENNNVTKTVSHLGSNLAATLGKSTFPADAYFNGSYDNVLVYNRALTADEVMALTAGLRSDEYRVNLEASTLTVPQTLVNDIELPTKGRDEEISVEWSSSDESVITSDGVITRADEDKTATLTATLELNGYAKTVSFEVTVLAREGGYTLEIDASLKGVDIGEDMYGVFFEDINYAADGGLYSEVVDNRSFEAAHCNPDRGEAYTEIPSHAWSAIGSADMTFRKENPLNEHNDTYLHLTAQSGGDGVENACYSGFSVYDGEKFTASLYARGDYDGDVTVSIVDGETVLGSVVFYGFSGEFAKKSATLTAKGASGAAKVRVTVSNKGEIDLDMISVIRQDTFNGRDNGLRKDLVQLLYDLHPSFVRFPGGCIVEGYYLNNRYEWKKTVGPVEEREENWNRWQTNGGTNDYCQTYGLGFYEYFLLCEDIGAKPLPVLNVGMACQYQSNEVSSWDDLYNIYIPDALDLIEFANGDPAENEWAALRAEMGHAEPFNLEYLGIGNEQWNTSTNRFFERYEAFEAAIHEKYPDIKLISTSGPSSDGTYFDNAWSWLKTHKGEENFTFAVDEHYYKSPDWFRTNANRYDNYDRDGFGVFAGEYAAHGSVVNSLECALAEAAFMTGLERNADVVRLASYAPLFAKIGYVQWSPDLIWFDNATAYGSVNYYVQSMYSNNRGDYTLENSLFDASETVRAGIGTWNTQSSFKDVIYTNDETGESHNLIFDYAPSGSWSVSGGAINQSSSSTPALDLAIIDAKNYTVELKAMKTGGAEGFLIPINYYDNNNYVFWNIGGWGNTQSNIQRVLGGEKVELCDFVPTVISTGRWYDIKVVVHGGVCDCYLDGELIQSASVRADRGPLYSTVSYDGASGDIIVKIVNTANEKTPVAISVENAEILPRAEVYTLCGSDGALVNTAQDPKRVCCEESSIDYASSDFEYSIPGYSFTVLRLHTGDCVISSQEVKTSSFENLPKTVSVTLSNGETEQRGVTWDAAGEGAFHFGGENVRYGSIDGASVMAKAVIDSQIDGARVFANVRGDALEISWSGEGAMFIAAAFYDGAGNLVSVASRILDGESGAAAHIGIPDGAEKAKAMLWNGNMQPVGGIVTIDLL